MADGLFCDLVPVTSLPAPHLHSGVQSISRFLKHHGTATQPWAVGWTPLRLWFLVVKTGRPLL